MTTGNEGEPTGELERIQWPTPPSRARHRRRAGPRFWLGYAAATVLATALIGTVTALRSTQSNEPPSAAPSTQARVLTVVRTVTAPPPPLTVINGDGTFSVPADIAPGTYRSQGGDPNCYWARLRGLGGTPEEVIVNSNTLGPAVVTIARTDKGFETSGCLKWTKVR